MNGAETPGDASLVGLVLFVAGDAPRTRRARANLKAALAGLGLARAWPREVDVLRDPAEAVAFGMFATPALALQCDGVVTRVLYGDFADRQRLQDFMRDALDDPPAVDLPAVDADAGR